MNLKGMIVSIVTAMVVVAIFVAMIGPAAAFDCNIGKSTLTAPGGTVNNSLEYVLGQQVNYTMHFSPTSENCIITSAKDIFPDGTDKGLVHPDDYPISLNKSETIGWETIWVVNGDGIGSDGTIVNYLEVKGFDAGGNPFDATIPKSSKLHITVAFTHAATDCMEVTVTPEYSGPVAWHQWILNGVPGSIVDTPPVNPIIVTGLTSVTLIGGSDTSNYADYVEFSDTIDVAGEPTVTVKRNPPAPQCVEIGDSVTFSIDSLTNDTPMDTYEWTFTNGIAGSGVLPWPSDGDVSITRTIPTSDGTKATLTVVDELGCESEDDVSVCVIVMNLSFTYAATDCMEVTVTPEYSGPVAWHQWILNGVPGSIVDTPPVNPIIVTGLTSVTLIGGSDTSNYADYVEFSDTIDVAGEPTVTVKRNPPAPQCVEIGDSVTFSIDSLTNDTPMDTYEWTFTNGIAGSGVLPWPSDGDVSITRTIPTSDGTKATLTVVDELRCESEGYVTVCVKPLQEVPLLTLPGLLALIGMMCIVGAGRILTRCRRS